ncbi:polysaccharide deacetylase family protein [Chitinispirillales bacterium ANBcel5]|uniref:polysaccharide deacetylase family protein n=1 Tax=Cellulosispirillum alkaliphilum TaxID=3039283 RepID=UPI002A55CACB|nr:polysaccharide deacetylase family protein [Chitinispirillales bacterium ANBcel5]
MNSFKTMVSLAVFVFFTQVFANPPSTNPPGGLQAGEVPQFVVIGFDDNTSAEGMEWIVDFLATKTNPEGSGNEGTFDGTPVLSTFYCISSIVESRPNLPSQLRRAVEFGHSIGNHSHTHTFFGDSLVTMGYDTWVREIDTCTQVLSRLLGIDPSEIYGFRAPHLRFNDTTFRVLSDLGFLYDCSIREGFQVDQDGTNNFWPYTMEDGSPGWETIIGSSPERSIGSYPDLWQVPIYAYTVPTCPEISATYGIDPYLHERIGTKINGGDYGMWFRDSLTPNDILGLMKYNLDLRLQNNRAPLTFLAHTQYYTQAYADMLPFSLDSMRGVIENFIEYALAQPEVRIVTSKDLIDWCKDPVPLHEEVLPEQYRLYVKYGSGSGMYDSGTVVTITANAPSAGQKFKGWTGDSETVSNPLFSTTQVVIGTSDIGIRASYTNLTHWDTVSTGNLITRADWQVSSDECGSVVDSEEPIVTDLIAGVNYTLADHPPEECERWVDLGAYFEDYFEGLSKIVITYKSTSDIHLWLNQDNLFATRHSYKTQLNASQDWITDTIFVMDGRFSQPQTIETPSPFDLSSIQSISFSPVIDSDTELEGSIEIRELIFYGVEWDIPTFATNTNKSRRVTPLRLNATSRALQVSVPQEGTYSISIYSLDGRRLLNYDNMKLKTGLNNLNWNRFTPGSRMFIVSVRGEGVNAVRRLVLKN